MTKTNLKTVAKNSVDNFIWIGKKKYTKEELALHGVAIYEKMYLNNENQFYKSENKRLKEIVDDFLVEDKSTFAKVLSDKNSPFFKSVIINKGSKHGINLGSVALDKKYLVGKVVEVNFASSRVLLLSDLNSKIPVILEPMGHLSIMSGTGKNYGIIEYNQNQTRIDEDMIVYTSGAGGLFRSGIPIGKIDINSFENEDQKINFYSDFSQLKFVKILSYKKAEN